MTKRKEGITNMKVKNKKNQNKNDINISPEIMRLLLDLQSGKISIDDVSEQVQEMASN